MNATTKIVAVLAALLIVAVGVVARGPVQAAAPAQVEAIAPFTVEAGEPAPNVVDCVFWGMPAVDQGEASVVDQRVETNADGEAVILAADLGRMGTFDISGSAAGITVSGSDQARAALMQFEMNACLGTSAFDPAQHDALLSAAGQAPAGD